MSNLLAFDISWLLGEWILPVLMFLAGLGLVVFIHELGHFMVAKFVGIKVERFAIGMGPPLIKIPVGETEYCLCALPLGGYVKMLGQEDFAPLEDGQEQQLDPRSYQAKSVGARFAVISAGVIMNLIGAAMLFILVGMIGIKFPAPIVGGVVPGSSAEMAEIQWDTPLPGLTPDGQQRKTTQGLIPGDKILSLDGEEIESGMDLKVKPALANKDEVFTTRIERPLDGKTYLGTAELKLTDMPSPSGGTINGLGIRLAGSLTFAKVDDERGSDLFQPEDRIVGFNGKPIEHSWQISRWAKQFDPADQPVPSEVDMTVQRGEQKEEITRQVPIHLLLKQRVVFLKSTGEMLRLGSDGKEPDGDKLQLTLESGRTRTIEKDDLLETKESQDILGMLPRAYINTVIDGSPADEAGLEPGDIIYEYYDRVLPTPAQIFEINKDVKEGGGLIGIIREGSRKDLRKISPTQRDGRALIGINPLPDVSHAVIADVREGSPAQKQGLKSQDRILSVNGRKVSGWIDVFNAIGQAQHDQQEVVLRVDRGSEEPVEVSMGLISQDQLNPDFYEINVDLRLPPRQRLMGPELHFGPVEALGWGVGQVGKFAASTYITLKALFVGSVSTREVSGPVGIGDTAIRLGRDSFVRFLWFMGIISVSLAVINFLPLPVVDGGHAVFLLIEKIRGKPLPIKVQNAIQIGGLILLVGLFLLITFQDIDKLLDRMW